MKHFFIIANPLKDPDLESAGQIADFLVKSGCHVRIRTDTAAHVSNYTDVSEIPRDTECILVLGGDGTLIEAARDTVGMNIPLLGVNFGSLGFLAEVEKNNVEQALTLLMHDRYKTESRMMLSGRHCRGGECLTSSYALNDIVVARSGSLQIIRFRIYVNGQFLNEYNADGIIFSTPTGSTGYNMSAGGPIVEPRARLLVITPICPHTLNTRSIVLAAEDEIVVEMAAGKGDAPLEAQVSFDGGHASLLAAGDRIEVKRSEKTTDIVKISELSFLEALHKKMSEK